MLPRTGAYRGGNPQVRQSRDYPSNLALPTSIASEPSTQQVGLAVLGVIDQVQGYPTFRVSGQSIVDPEIPAFFSPVVELAPRLPVTCQQRNLSCWIEVADSNRTLERVAQYQEFGLSD